MQRGDIVIVSAPGDFGKPRPSVVVRSDLFTELPSVTVCLMSSELRDAPILRITVDPTVENGLTRISQVQVEKLVTLALPRVGAVVGRLDGSAMERLTRSLALYLGIA